MQDEVIGAVAGDPPAAVVQVHGVETTEKYPAVDVGTTTIAETVDVMGFAVRGGAVAISPSATAVADG